jgi:hypothetical protein
MAMKILTIGCGFYAAIVLTGCSIGMALSGNKQPNFDYIVVGSPRNQVEAELGHPTATNESADGKQEATYKYEMGNSPNPGRATMYGYAWLTIIGILGEPIYSLIELNMGHDEETRIVYGLNNRVLEIHGYTPPPASKAVIKAKSPASKAVLEAEELQEKYIERRRNSQSAPAEQSTLSPTQ